MDGPRSRGCGARSGYDVRTTSGASPSHAVQQQANGMPTFRFPTSASPLDFGTGTTCRVNRPSPKLRKQTAIRRAICGRPEPPSLTRKAAAAGPFGDLENGGECSAGADWSGRRDSNPRPQPWQGCALPLSYARAPDQGAVSRRLPHRLQAAPQARHGPAATDRRALVWRAPRNIYASTSQSKARNHGRPDHRPEPIRARAATAPP